MSNSRHECEPRAGDVSKRRSSVPLRLRVPRLSADSAEPMQLLDAADSSHAPPAEQSAAELARATSDAQVPDGSAPRHGESSSRRQLRFDAAAESGKQCVAPPYMATRHRSRALVALLWAGGGALITGAIIAVGMALVEPRREKAGGGEDGNTSDIRWTQEPQAPLRTTSSDPAAVPEENSISLDGSIGSHRRIAVDEPEAMDTRDMASDPGATNPPHEDFEPVWDDCAPPEMGVNVTDAATNDNVPFLGCGIQPSPNWREGSETSDPQTRPAYNPPPLPADISSPHETYPRTNASNWKFSDSSIAERESLRTSMRPGPTAPGDREESSSNASGQDGPADGGQYRLRGTIDDVPLR